MTIAEIENNIAALSIERDKISEQITALTIERMRMQRELACNKKPTPAMINALRVLAEKAGHVHESRFMGTSYWIDWDGDWYHSPDSRIVKSVFYGLLEREAIEKTRKVSYDHDEYSITEHGKRMLKKWDKGGTK